MKAIDALLQYIHDQYDGTDARVLQLALAAERELARMTPDPTATLAAEVN